MARIPAIAAGLLLLVAPLGVARSAPRYTMEPHPVFAPGPADSARLYLMREQFVRARPLSPEELYLDGAPLALLPQRAFAIAVVAPGRRCVSGEAGLPAFWLDCRAGRDYLMRLRETIDDQDQRHLEWLLDDPGRIETLANALALAHAITTPKGLRSMGGPRRLGAAPAADSLPFVLEGMWFEDPHRPESLKPTYARESWRVTVDSSGVKAAGPNQGLEIPIAGITALRFGGVRGQSNQPWLEVEYGAEGGRAAFADSRLETSTRTYNRLFTALRELWIARGGGTGSRP